MNGRVFALLTSLLVWGSACQDGTLSPPNTTPDASTDQAADLLEDTTTQGDETSDTPGDPDASDDRDTQADQPSDEQPDAAPQAQDWLVGQQGWTNLPLPSTSGAFNARFFMRAQQAGINGVVGLSLGQAGAYTDLGVIVRMNNQGQMDVRDGSDYATDAAFDYTPNEPVLVEVSADLPAKLYSVWVTGADGRRVLLKRDASLRTEQQGLTEVDHLGYLEPQGDLDVGDVSIDGNPVPLTPAMPPVATPLWGVDFQNSPLGNYTDANIRADWEGTKWTTPQNRAEIREEAGNRFVRITYAQGRVGPGGAAQWATEFSRAGRASFDELYVSYKMRFRSGFNWVKGGKLPGLLGGAGNTGGNKPNGSDGWSARMMWRRDGEAVQYVYHPDQPGIYGEDFFWKSGAANLRFPTNTWITVEHRVVMNTPGQSNGMVQGWYNGQLSLTRTGVRFRDINSFAIDGFYFSTFFGGGTPDWSPPRDEYIDFDDFAFSDKPLTH